MNQSDPNRKKAQDAGTFLALIGLLIAGGLLLLMVTAILPDAMRGFMITFLIISAMLCFHYFTWGRAMERSDRLKRSREQKPGERE